MADLSPESRTVLGWALSVISGLFSALLVLLWWIWNRTVSKFDRKIEQLETAQGTFVPAIQLDARFASAEHMRAVELRLADTASRKELIAHMEQLAADRQRMHDENLKRLDTVVLDIRELRGDFRAVHSRIDEIVSAKS